MDDIRSLPSPSGAWSKGLLSKDITLFDRSGLVTTWSCQWPETPLFGLHAPQIRRDDNKNRREKKCSLPSGYVKIAIENDHL